jgi:hypothetical protein
MTGGAGDTSHDTTERNGAPRQITGNAQRRLLAAIRKIHLVGRELIKVGPERGLKRPKQTDQC